MPSAIIWKSIFVDHGFKILIMTLLVIEIFLIKFGINCTLNYKNAPIQSQLQVFCMNESVEYHTLSWNNTVHNSHIFMKEWCLRKALKITIPGLFWWFEKNMWWFDQNWYLDIEILSEGTELSLFLLRMVWWKYVVTYLSIFGTLSNHILSQRLR
jgi:hypothetical protein